MPSRDIKIANEDLDCLHDFNNPDDPGPIENHISMEMEHNYFSKTPIEAMQFDKKNVKKLILF